MNTAFRLIILILVSAAVILLTSKCFSTQRVLRISDGRIIAFNHMIREIKGSNLIFVGEIHDLKAHHKAQLRIIEALHKTGVPIAIGLEMFTAESQQVLDRWVAGTMEKDGFIRLYYNNWRMPWPLYSDIFLYAQRKRVPMIGLNAPQEIVQKVSKEGFASLTGEEKKKLPPSITCNVSTPYMEFIKKAYAEHVGKEDSFLHFCEAQMLWNKTMAWHLVTYLGKRPGKRVVVLTGEGHALKRAIPEEVRELSAFNYKVILQETPDMPARSLSMEEADYVLLMR